MSQNAKPRGGPVHEVCRLEALEARLLLAGADISLASLVGDGLQTLWVDYQIDGNDAEAFEIGLFGSDDRFFDGDDTLISALSIADPIDLAVGTHRKSFAIGSDVALPGAGAETLAGDQFILPAADPAGAVFSADGVALVGAYHLPGGDVYVHGTVLADTILVTAAGKALRLGLGETILTYQAADVSGFEIRSHEGDDTVSGVRTSKPLLVFGGDGDDALSGGNSSDGLIGGAGSDALVGWAGDDVLLGDDGNDLLDGGKGDDHLDGGDGDDALLGGAGRDFLLGGAGANTLTGGGGADVWAIPGTDGPDDIVLDSTLKPAEAFCLSGGTAIQQDTFTDLAAKSDSVLATGGDGNDTITVLGPVRSVLLGGGGNDALTGGGGKDCLYGGSGDNMLWGGEGKDSLIAGDGSDSLDGGPGVNTIVVGTGPATIAAGTGRNNVVLQGAAIESAPAAPLEKALSDAGAGTTLSFSATVPLSGSMFGFRGSATADATVTGTVDEKGIFTGSLAAFGYGIAFGKGGATADFDFDASGDVSGPLKKLIIKARWDGSATVFDPDIGTYNVSGSGSWSGVVSLASGVGKQSIKGDRGSPVSFKGTMPVVDFTVSGAADPFAVSKTRVLSSKLLKNLPPAFFCATAAKVVLNNPLVDWSRKSRTGEHLLEQIQRQAQWLPIVGTSSPDAKKKRHVKSTYVRTQVFQLIHDLATDFGGVRPNDLAGDGHGLGGGHYDGWSLDLGSVGEWTFGDSASDYGEAIKGMYDHSLLSTGGRGRGGKNDLWRVGIGSGVPIWDFCALVEDFVQHVKDAGGTVPTPTENYTKKPGLTYLSSITVRGKDKSGNVIYVVFFRDAGRNHLHIKVPPNYFGSVAG